MFNAASNKDDADFLEKLSNFNPTSNREPTASELRKMKQIEKEMTIKLETKLIDQFSTSKHPYWFNLILIENCRDYSFNKYNSLASFTLKTFEKWIQSLNEKQLSVEYLNDEIKKAAFIISCKYHLLLVDTIAKLYKLTESNEFILPYLKYRISPDCNLRLKLDFKDKAILINACMFHEHFDCQEVIFKYFICLCNKI